MRIVHRGVTCGVVAFHAVARLDDYECNARVTNALARTKREWRPLLSALVRFELCPAIEGDTLWMSRDVSADAFT